MGANATVLQSQRDCVLQRRVVRHELPWETPPPANNPNGVATLGELRGATQLGFSMEIPEKHYLQDNFCTDV